MINANDSGTAVAFFYINIPGFGWCTIHGLESFEKALTRPAASELEDAALGQRLPWNFEELGRR
ncbi:MAG: hypothetical protein D6814_00380 [Calditrichaeota bacterium]|nr:MAG: hypothetical protein D6814_00380 [Calditrichota bacterium]